MWFLALFSVVASGLLLGLSIFPGVLEQIPRSTAALAGGMLGGLMLGACVRHVLRKPTVQQPRRRVSALVVLLALLVTPTLLFTYTPRRLAFRAYQSDFERLLATAQPPIESSASTLNEDLAVFWIDQWGADRRGGTYFRTMSTGQKGGADQRSFGFAHRPNPDGCPFGDQQYSIQHLTGDWYSFSAADE